MRRVRGGGYNWWKKVWDWNLTASQTRVEIWRQWMQEEINPGEVMTKEQSGSIIMGVY